MNDVRRLVLLTLAAFILFGYGLGAGTLWDEDEARYAQVAVDMVATGDPFTLRIDGRPWFDKPPLYMWLQAATGRLVGFSEFTARVWSAVSGATSVAATFLIAQRLYGSRTALIAAAMLATMMEFFVLSRVAVLDALLVAFMLLTLHMALVGQDAGDAASARRAYGWALVWAGCATAAKTPIGLVFPATVVALLWLIRGEGRRWREIPLWGVALYAIIGLNWYAVETVRFGVTFLHAALGSNVVGRIYRVVDEQPGPWWYYAPLLMAGTFPWTAFVPSAIVYHLRRRRDRGSQVILLWVGVVLLIYSIAATKLPNYILPVYPLLAIGIARLCVDALEAASADAPRLMRWAFRLLGITVAIFTGLTGVYGLIRYPAEFAGLRVPLLVIAAVLAAFPLAAVVLYYRGRPVPALVALMLMLPFATPVLVHHALPAVEHHRPMPRIARFVRQSLGPDDVLGAVGLRKSPSLRYYSQRPVVWIDNQTELRDAVCRFDRLVLVVPEGAYREWAASILPSSARTQWQDSGHRIVRKDTAGPCAASGLVTPKGP